MWDTFLRGNTNDADGSGGRGITPHTGHGRTLGGSRQCRKVGLFPEAQPETAEQHPQFRWSLAEEEVVSQVKGMRAGWVRTESGPSFVREWFVCRILKSRLSAELVGLPKGMQEKRVPLLVPAVYVNSTVLVVGLRRGRWVR